MVVLSMNSKSCQTLIFDTPRVFETYHQTLRPGILAHPVLRPPPFPLEPPDLQSHSYQSISGIFIVNHELAIHGGHTRRRRLMLEAVLYIV
jgi:hypothetical protein